MKTFINLVLSMTLVLSVTACGGKKAGDGRAAGNSVALDPGQKLILGTGNRGLKKVQDALKAGKKISSLDCVMVQTAIKKLDGVKKKRTCRLRQGGQEDL